MWTRRGPQANPDKPPGAGGAARRALQTRRREVTTQGGLNVTIPTHKRVALGSFPDKRQSLPSKSAIVSGIQDNIPVKCQSDFLLHTPRRHSHCTGARDPSLFSRSPNRLRQCQLVTASQHWCQRLWLSALRSPAPASTPVTPRDHPVSPPLILMYKMRFCFRPVVVSLAEINS